MDALSAAATLELELAERRAAEDAPRTRLSAGEQVGSWAVPVRSLLGLSRFLPPKSAAAPSWDFARLRLESLRGGVRFVAFDGLTFASLSLGGAQLLASQRVAVALPHHVWCQPRQRWLPWLAWVAWAARAHPLGVVTVQLLANADGNAATVRVQLGESLVCWGPHDPALAQGSLADAARDWPACSSRASAPALRSQATAIDLLRRVALDVGLDDGVAQLQLDRQRVGHSDAVEFALYHRDSATPPPAAMPAGRPGAAAKPAHAFAPVPRYASALVHGWSRSPHLLSLVAALEAGNDSALRIVEELFPAVHARAAA